MGNGRTLDIADIETEIGSGSVVVRKENVQSKTKNKKIKAAHVFVLCATADVCLDNGS